VKLNLLIYRETVMVWKWNTRW